MVASPDPLDAWAGFTIMGLGALAAYAAWNQIDGGASGLIMDVIRTGHIPSGLKGSAGPGSKVAEGPLPTSAASGAAQWALQQRGKPYKWGATGPDSFDCSGLAQAAYKHVGITIPRTTYLQIGAGVGVPVTSAPQIGDLVFPEPAHVMIALGDGTAVQSPHTGAFVDVIPVPTKPLAIRRIVKGG
jgi:peptidoglycan DL-endopeptidase CwlO